MRVFSKILIILLSLSIAGYFSYQAILYARQQLQIRFAQMHELLADDEIDSENATEEELARREETLTTNVNADSILPWQIIAQAKIQFAPKSAGDAAAPQYSQTVKALNNKTITIRGFIFPLDKSLKQTHFLLSAKPPSCPYCLPAGPNELIEVWMQKPIDFSYEAITIKGKFQLLEKDEDIKSGMFYRMVGGDIV